MTISNLDIFEKMCFLCWVWVSGKSWSEVAHMKARIDFRTVFVLRGKGMGEMLIQGEDNFG